MINYTVVMDNSHFGVVSSVFLSLIETPRVEQIFRLSNGATSRTYDSAELQVAGPITIISDNIVIYNNPRQPLAPETFHFALGATIIGVNSGIVVVQRGSIGLVEVLAAAAGKGALVTSIIIIYWLLFFPPDPCNGQPCSNGGTCTASGQTFSCSCPPTHTGATCMDLQMGLYFDPVSNGYVQECPVFHFGDITTRNCTECKYHSSRC